MREGGTYPVRDRSSIGLQKALGGRKEVTIGIIHQAQLWHQAKIGIASDRINGIIKPKKHTTSSASEIVQQQYTHHTKSRTLSHAKSPISSIHSPISSAAEAKRH
jgi:hypothetical protein